MIEFPDAVCRGAGGTAGETPREKIKIFKKMALQMGLFDINLKRFKKNKPLKKEV